MTPKQRETTLKLGKMTLNHLVTIKLDHILPIKTPKLGPLNNLTADMYICICIEIYIYFIFDMCVCVCMSVYTNISL